MHEYRLYCIGKKKIMENIFKKCFPQLGQAFNVTADAV